MEGAGAVMKVKGEITRFACSRGELIRCPLPQARKSFGVVSVSVTDSRSIVAPRGGRN